MMSHWYGTEAASTYVFSSLAFETFLIPNVRSFMIPVHFPVSVLILRDEFDFC